MRDTYSARRHPSPSQGKHNHRTARLMREITIALIIMLIILSAICFVAGFVLFNMATGEW